MKLTKKQKNNCYKMAEFLESLPEESLDMECYVTEGPRDEPPKPECGSVCCVLGWAPAVFDCEEMKTVGHYSYSKISKNIFGVEDSDEEDDWTEPWTYLFSASNPNDPHEAARRLRYWADEEEVEYEYY